MTAARWQDDVDALSLIDEAVFAVAIARAVPAVCDDDGPAVAVINYASLQVPQLLAPHLRAMGARWAEPLPRDPAWRGADAPERERLLVELERAERRRFYPDERVGGRRAALALLESRHEPTIPRVLASPLASAQKSAAIELHAHAVGFDPEGRDGWCRTGAGTCGFLTRCRQSSQGYGAPAPRSASHVARCR